MPIYEYRCPNCDQIFEEWQRDFEERDVPCPVCNETAKRLISSTSFILKGSGWYVTDYANRHSNGAPGNGSVKSGTSADSPSESTTPAETKSSDASKASASDKKPSSGTDKSSTAAA